MLTRDSVNEISLIDSFKKDLGPAERHILNIHDLEAYNKVIFNFAHSIGCYRWLLVISKLSFNTKQFITQGRQTMLNRCINEACGNPNRIPGMYMHTALEI